MEIEKERIINYFYLNFFSACKVFDVIGSWCWEKKEIKKDKTKQNKTKINIKKRKKFDNIRLFFFRTMFELREEAK